MVVGDGITDESCGGDARKRQAGIDGLNGATVRIIGRHAAHTGANTSDQQRNGGQAEQRGFRFHKWVDVE